ncbi:contactin isoform X2 [Toxorhynchites rutilus septentrionalis]|uniref:contactin isoform X2 n=1 Tax=Toxorhynchites rutilus septentrionalis TaxID=329112 RepID=UPI002479DEE3|nr:contactin isoform X2 [Toxorhynchites rutilus septentrionalis]
MLYHLFFLVSMLGIGCSQNTKYNQVNNPNSPTQYQTFNAIGNTGDSFYNSVSRYKQSEKLDSINSMENYCPEYWTSFRNTCIRIHKSPRKDYLSAQKICQAYRGDLISIDSLDKHTFILKLLNTENSKGNQYYVSARQTSPGSWTNADKSQLVSIEDSFNFNPIDESNIDVGFYGNKITQTQLDSQKKYGLNYNRDRNSLVYAFNPVIEKWQFTPVDGTNFNLFICESQQLYTVDNVNELADDRRDYGYGVEITDINKVPRGPYFIRQPRETTYDTGKVKITRDVMMSCLAGGYPTPTYTWYKELYSNDNVTVIKIDPLENARYTTSGGNLIIHTPQQIQDQGTYHCVAENVYGRVISESVELNFGYILEFNLQRSSEVGEMNWGKALYCDPPQHYPDVRYYWSRDFFPNFVEEDQRVFVSYDGSLYFSSLEIKDRANYSCNVQSTVSDTGRNGPFFNLQVVSHPHFKDLIFANNFPKNFPEAPLAGKDLRLECMAFGYPVPSYNWTRRNGNLPRYSYTESYNRVLVIKNSTVNDNGEYICTAKNDRKSISKSVLVNVQMQPNFTIPLRDKIKDYQSSVTFLCEAFAIPDVNYTWYKNAELLDYSKNKINRDKYIIQDNVLKINNLDPEEDDGMYQCKATNQLKGVYSSAQLRVLSIKPSFKKKPLEPEIYSIYNGNTTIECEPEAAPRPKIVWKKDGNVVGSGGHRRIMPTGTLYISSTSRDDEGVYTCVASNSQGVEESKSRLIVLQELRFIEQLPPKVIKQINEMLYLKCDVSYDELLDVAFLWAQNGRIIDANNDLQSVDPRIVVNYNSLEVHNLTLLDAGEYECIAKSAVNRIVSKTNVYIQGPPGAPGAIKVIDIKKTAAVLEWIDGNDNGRQIMFYNILGRTNWNKTWTNISENVLAQEVDRYNNRRRAMVNNLTPGCGYEFSVLAVNDLGAGMPSLPSPVYNTQKDKPYIAPRNVGGGGGKIGDLTIAWDPLLPQEQNSIDIHYKVYYRLLGQREWATEVLKRQGNVGRAVVHIPFDKYYTKYEVKVQAINDLGEGPISDMAVIYSAEDMPQVAPQQTLARGYNSTALNVSWVPVSQTRESIRGKLIGHRLKYWKKEHKEENAVYYLSRTTRPWALIVGLEPDTYYFVKVMAYNAAGEGPESERYMERTYRKAPQKPPSAVNIFGINPSTIRVVWRYIAPSQDEEPVQGYKIRIWETDQDMVTANDTVVWVGSKLEKYVDNLTPGKLYNLRVLAFSNGGDGRMSSPPIKFQMGM